MIKVFWEQEKGQSDKKRGFIARIELPDGNVTEFDHSVQKIDFEPCRPFIGQPLELFRNGVSVGVSQLDDISETEDGVLAIWFVPVDKDTFGVDEENLLN